MGIALARKLNGRIAMKKAFVALALAAISLPGWATTKVTVQQLEQTVTEIQGRGDQDRDAAQRLTELELTERLSKARYTKLNANLPGDKAKQALLALAGDSAFLDLPAEDILNKPQPDAATEGKIVSRAADFAVEAMSKMPDFYASRTITRFQDLKVTYPFGEPVVVAHQGFHFLDKTNATVLFRDGREVVQAGDGKKGSSVTMSTGLTNWGIFGPLLGVVMTDILKGKIGWGHWEQGATGPLAVFRYAVTEDRSSYSVRYCCFRGDKGNMHEFQAVPAYHGEIGIDPATGAVLRLVVRTDLESSLPMQRAEVAVEYGPVEIGGRTYICPLESTSLSKADALVFHGYLFYANKNGKPTNDPWDKLRKEEKVEAPTVTAINKEVFAGYHQFRGDVRILPSNGGETEADAPAAQSMP